MLEMAVSLPSQRVKIYKIPDTLRAQVHVCVSVCERKRERGLLLVYSSLVGFMVFALLY